MLDPETEERFEALEARMRGLESAAEDPWAGQSLAPPGPKPALSGPHLFPDSEPVVWGEVVSEVGSGKYTFKEKVLTDGTTWTDKTGGRTGDCYESNDVAGIAVGTIIKIRIAHDTGGTLRYVFDYEAGVPPGDADDEILVWDQTTDKAWEATTPTEITVVTAFQVTGVTLQVKTRTVKAVAAGAESGWTTAHTGTNCP